MMRVPIKPTATAIQRRGPTASRRTKADRTVTISGCTKKIAKASAIGSHFSDRKKKKVAATRKAARKV